MKVTCERDKLLAAFQIAASVAPTRSPKPILSNVKLEAGKDGTVLMATDLEVGVRVQAAGVTADAEGSCLLNVARFGSILRESGDAVLKIETDGRSTIVRGERSEFRLLAEDPQEYPAVADFKETGYWELPARLLKELVKRTVFATDNESSRYALGGVLLEHESGKITAVGTDGRRLAVMQGPCQANGGYKGSDGATIVPTRAMQLIERTVSDADAEVQVVARSNDILVRTQRAVIYSRLVEGRFPKWRDVFPKREGTQRISLAVGPTYAAVRQAAIVTSEESRGVDLTFADGKAVLAGRGAETGQSRIELPISYDGPSITIALDPRYLTDFFRVLDPEKTFTLELKDSDSAAVCTTDDGYGYVIMPLARDR
jgi:DNA polymerase III subunit beta